MDIKIKDYKELTFDNNVKLKEIVDIVQPSFKKDIIIGRNHNGLIELDEIITQNCEIEFFDETTTIGNKIVERGLVCLFTQSLRTIIPNTKINIKYSIGNGIMIELDKDITQDILEHINDIMKRDIKSNRVFNKIKINRLEAINYFLKVHDISQARLLNYIEDKYIHLYKCNDQYIYFNGPLPYNYSSVSEYKLILSKPNEVIINKVGVYKENNTLEYISHDKFYKSISNYETWGKRFNIKSILDLNDSIIHNEMDNLITLSEYNSQQELLEIAKHISNDTELKMILIGGASSSGKTTTTKKLELYLKTLGLTPYMISLDDYYKDKDKAHRVDGKLDFESVNALDLELFKKQMQQLLKGEEIIMPTFDFINGKKIFNKKFKLNDNNILLIEGLHALNDELSNDFDKKYKYKIYLSPSSYININNYNRINMTDIRLLRRLVRDNRTRGSDISQTLDMWTNVRVGEEKYVFPFQHNVDVIYNTSLVYELNVIKVYALPLLYSIRHDNPYYPEARRLIELLKIILPAPSDNIPKDSIIREFIGNSIFE